jgi:tetratricopeptide (TPR) repeat protein
MICLVKRVLVFGACIFMAAFAGCATPGTEDISTVTVNPGAPPWPGNKYSPKLPSGIGTLDDAKKDLAELLRTKSVDEGAGVRYFGQLDLNRPANQNNLTEYVKRVEAYMLIRDVRGEFKYLLPRGGITVLRDRISVNPAFTLFYTDLLGSHITVEKSRDEKIRYSWPDMNGNIVDESIAGEYANKYRPLYQRPYMIHCSGLISFFLKNQTDAEKFADDLFFIQQALQKEDNERRALFESKAAQYRGLAIKPPVSEEQRRYIVQANVLSQQKDYAGAYFNLALLSAQLRRFESAISYMKQYLSLVPDAKDARSAQDKIYEWEIVSKK